MVPWHDANATLLSWILELVQYRSTSSWYPTIGSLQSFLGSWVEIGIHSWMESNIIFHQPRFPWNKGISLTKPPFGVRSCEVAIIWPDYCILNEENHFFCSPISHLLFFYLRWSFVGKISNLKKRKTTTTMLARGFWLKRIGSTKIFRSKFSTNWMGSHGTWLFPWSFWDCFRKVPNPKTELSNLLDFNESSLVGLNL